MNEEELMSRAAFQVLMSARAHIAHTGRDYETDRILASALNKVRIHLEARAGKTDYLVAWRTFTEPLDSPRVGTGVEITVMDDKKKFTFFKNYEDA